MSWCNFLRRTGSDFCPTDKFPRASTHFGFMMFNTQQKISTYVDPRLYNLQLKSVFQTPLSMCLVIVEKELWTWLIWRNFQNLRFRIYVFMFFFTVALNKKLKIRNTIKTECQLYSKPGSPIFLLLGSWSLVLYLLDWVKSKFLR